jgi:hypothetical protein
VTSFATEISTSQATGAGRLLTQLEAAWDDLSKITDELVQASQGLHGVPERPCNFLPTRQQYVDEAGLLLIAPTQQFARLRPIRRSLESMQEFDRQAPSGSVSAREHIDDEFQSLLCFAALNLCEAWRIRQSNGTNKEWSDWEAGLAKRAARAKDVLAKYRKWSSEAANKSGATHKGQDPDRHKRIEAWWRRQKAVSDLHEMEVAFYDLRATWLSTANNLAETLREERAEILSLSEKMIDWISSGADIRTPAPAESMILATCDERLRTWSNLIEEEARKSLPEEAQVISPRRQIRFRAIHPREAFLSTFHTFCEPAMRQSVGEYWEGTAKVVREASRSKEIIDYWRAEAIDHSQQKELFDQARTNAASVLAEQLHTSNSSETLESTLAHTFWMWSEEGSVVLEAAEIGWVEVLRKPRGRRLSQAIIREGQKHSRRAVHRAGQWGADQWERALETIGGKLPTRPTANAVVRRTTLRDTLSLPASKNELPIIYGSLFRLAPIEDRRFLIGRDRELAGLEQALNDWDAGRFAACIFVGARGSGKTSLLNCAASGAFAGREILRSQFRERAVTADAIDNFLRRLLGLSPNGDLEAAFNSSRRILMIEEGERIYLRKVGGFEGACRLMHWIQRTALTTLWVIVMNDRSFQVLCAGAQFSRVFSHRINAMSVSRVDLENALLERHRLSGLRLEFAPPPATDRRISRIKNVLGLEESPQKLFFDSLYQQSGGVFRSAFELWLSSIERVEGETLKIRQPLEPAFAPLRGELQQEDLFTLLVIQEHGSLEYRELSEVLCEEIEVSQARMDRLAALGLIDKDPEHSGLRVRPEAHRFASAALRRVNLTEELE